MLVALEIEDALQDLGLVVIGIVSRLDAALEIAKSADFDAAILDVNIRGGTSYEVADILIARKIPFIFASGYGEWSFEERHRNCPRLSKPYGTAELEESVLGMLNGTSSP
jgi:CheY-like chemotaxis protein